ncbi:sigma-54 dependent transcriptional regulator [Desulfococcaceae bacterium HSG8]|nr:sigma-54 dependent transcriptional regulator [Desulfococcaceae bacterium HSG8]
MDNENITDIETSQKRLLIIDDEENMRHMLGILLRKSGYIVDTAPDGAEGLKMLNEAPYDFTLCDLKMPHTDGMAFLKEAGDKLEETTVIMMSAYGTIDTAIEAMKLGAYDYISKPFKPDEVHLALKKAEERESLRKENLRLKERLRKIEEDYKFGKMVAKSQAMKSVFKLSEKASHYNTTVLITGESGTGKELVARSIHFRGERAKANFVPVNCGGIPDNLLESEFFGHKKGAFTGADRNKKGLFEEAERGTIFLDEIGELPLGLQVKFLRVLQENEIRPVGDSKTKKINARVIAATAKHLEDEVEAGRFRQDLFYRLNVLPVRLPSLRNRPEDIPILCQHFIRKFNKILGNNIKGITPDAMSVLLTHRWPGNVRELENAIERAIVLSEDIMLSKENFPPEVGMVKKDSDGEDVFSGYCLKDAQKVLEKKMITKALVATGGNRTKAVQLLGISHPSLLNKIKAYKITI